MRMQLVGLLAGFLVGASLALGATASVSKMKTMTIKTALVHPRVLSGLEIQVESDGVSVLPGVCRLGESTVKVAQSQAMKIEPLESIAVNDEEYELTGDAPDRWIKGTHLKGCVGAGGTALPGCLVPGSVVVKLSDGTIAKENADYRLDTKWAGLSRVPTGRIG